MGATDAFLLSPNGSINSNGKSTHCSHTCSIVLLCTIVPFCILSILFLIVYASCGHKYLTRKRKARERQRQQKELREIELRKLGGGDSNLGGDFAYSKEEDGLVRDLESRVDAAPAPPPIARERPGEQRASVVAAAALRR